MISDRWREAIIDAGGLLAAVVIVCLVGLTRNIFVISFVAAWVLACRSFVTNC